MAPSCRILDYGTIGVISVLVSQPLLDGTVEISSSRVSIMMVGLDTKITIRRSRIKR